MKETDSETSSQSDETSESTRATSEDDASSDADTVLVDEKEAKEDSDNGEEETPEPREVCPGLTDEELWLLVRRFNKRVFNVRRMSKEPIGRLDLVPSENEQHSPSKLRVELERLYMTWFTGGAAVVKHIARLRSWKEWPRTLAFMTVYVIAWIFDLVLPAIILLFMLLIASRTSRRILFPPVPLATVSAHRGEKKEPRAGVLGSYDSLTGAAETYKGQAVEAEASDFVSAISSILFTAVFGGKADGGEGEGEGEGDDKKTSEKKVASRAEKAAKVGGADPQTQAAIQTSIWTRVGPFVRLLSEVSDNQERFANALSPTKPFSHLPRFRLAALLIPAVLSTTVVPAHWVAKGAGAILGFAFFGQPIIDRARASLTAHVPDWSKYLHIQNSLLAGVPSNAQLAIALLRIGEQNDKPLPPPPDEAEDSKPSGKSAQGIEDGAAEAATEEVAEQNALADAIDAKPGYGSRIVGALVGTAVGTAKTTARVGINAVLGVDSVKASVSESSKQRLGVVPTKKSKWRDGPSSFACRLHGQQGTLAISTTSGRPYLSYSKSAISGSVTVWTIQVDDLVELRKIAILGLTSRFIVGAVLQQELTGSLEVVDVEGHVYRLTAIKRRDELFNRLVAMGSQKWELT